MDKDQPFAGDQSPRIILDLSTPHGIRQSGIAVITGKKYTGRIWQRGAPGNKVKAELIWGEGATARQTIASISLTGAYKKFLLEFTAQAGTNDATLEITGTGNGDFHIGAVSLMPAR